MQLNKNDNSKHLTREEILKAIAQGVTPSAEHLRNCPDCLALFEALRHFDGVADEVIEQPPAHLMEKLSAIPHLVGSRPARVKVRGDLIYDSWRDIPAAQLRGAAPVRERRLHFGYGSVGLEIVAEWQATSWEFTARIYDGKKISCKYVIKVGRERVAPEMHDCYYFKRSTLPKTLTLISPDLQIAFDVPGRSSETRS